MRDAAACEDHNSTVCSAHVCGVIESPSGPWHAFVYLWLLFPGEGRQPVPVALFFVTRQAVMGCRNGAHRCHAGNMHANVSRVGEGSCCVKCYFCCCP